ncbi:MAG: universal stress protein [Solirubrobacteraceae bacterium]
MFSRILVGYDGSGRSEDALLLARLLGRTGPAHVTAVYVYGYRRSTRINVRTGEFALTFADAERTLALLHERLGDEIEVRPVADFSAPRGLQTLAGTEDADLIVVGSTTRGRWGRTFPGTTGDRLLSGAPCAVAVVPLGYRGESMGVLHRIGVAYRRGDDAALSVGHAVAEHPGAALTVISAFDEDDRAAGEDAVKARGAAQRDLDYALAQLSDGAPVRGRLVDGPAIDVLRAYTADLDLLIMGSRAQGPVRRTLLGSVSHGVLVDSLCPVIVVPRGLRSLGDTRSSLLDSKNAT